MKKFRAFLYSKSFNISLSVLLNIALYVYLVFFVGMSYYTYVCLATTGLFMLSLLVKNSNSKQNFLILLMCISMPIVALTLFRYSSSVRGSKRLRNKWKELTNLQTIYTEEDNKAVISTLSKKSILMSKTSRYVNATLTAPVYENNSVALITDGKVYYDNVLKALKGAKKYIFIECSKMHDCKVWTSIFQILKEKTFAGVEIKLLYDDYNSISAFKDSKTFEKLFNHKIETMAFNRLSFAIGKISSYRNQNNTIIIDGETAFCGQFGIDDEYIDKAHIGDSLPKKLASAVCICGDAVITLTKNFVVNWNLFTHTNSLVLEKYIPKSFAKTKVKHYIQPFEINPLIKENVSKNIQNNLINSASQSIWMLTPYLLLGNESMNALVASARCGVDVNIIVSKEYKSSWQDNLSYTNYGILIKEGIKIYTIDQAIIDSQIIVADRNNLLIGGGNIDSRKMYSPFLNGVLIYDEDIANKAISEIQKILPCATLLTTKILKKRKFIKKLNGSALKMFSPLM